MPPSSRTTAPTSGKPFVGRARELGELERALEEAIAERGALFFLVGEPGIGKTRLAEELGRCAAARARVLWGRCWEGDGAPPFWPWMQILRGHVRGRDADALAAELGPSAAQLSPLLPPELRGALVAPTELVPVLESDAARFQLFDAFAAFLRRTAETAPLLLVLDDIHWADPGSLLLLQFVANEIRDSRILIVGAYREVEARRAPQLREILGQLAHRAGHVPLRGLSEAEITLFLESRNGTTPERRFVEAVHHATEGNPFFLGEAVRLFEAEATSMRWAGTLSGALRIPEGVRAVIESRLSFLSETCREIAAIASVGGREFEADVVQAVSARPLDEIVGVLDEAIEAQLVVEVSRVRGRYRFSHALVREALYEGLSSPRRRVLHRETARVIEQLHENDLSAHIAELAHHFYESVTAEDAAKAGDYEERAGDDAETRLAYEDAVRHYRRALEVLDLAGGVSDARRCALLLKLGFSQWRASELDPSRESFRRAAEIAERLGNADAFARAALGFAGIEIAVSFGEGKGSAVVTRLERALELLDPGDGELRALALADLAALPAYLDPHRRAALADEAIAMARRIGHRPTLARVLRTVQQGIVRADNVEQRLTQATEMIALADEVGDSRLAAEAHVWWVASLFEAGDAVGAARATRELERRAEALRDPDLRWRVLSLGALRALLDGRYDDAERLSQEALASGQQRQNIAAVMAFGGQMFALRREQGRLAEMADAIAGFGAQFPDLFTWRIADAWLRAELGRPEEARRIVESLAADGFAALFDDVAWGANVWSLGETIAAIDDAKTAAPLYERLLPYADRFVNATCAIAFDSLARILGLLATTLRRFDEAEAHFERALARNETLGSPPWVAWTRHGLATMLRRRNRPGDGERAAANVESALATARALGMKALEERILAAHPAAGASVKGVALFHREGDFWTITYAGTLVRVKDIRGLHHIHRLLAEPGRDFHCADLLGEGGAERGDGGEILDREAKAAYRRRIEALEDDLAEAERNNDLGRKAKAQEEIDFLSRELSAAVGLGGRDRRAADATERARLRVTKTIKLAIERIGEQNRALAYHLTSTIRTGNFCSYAPDPDDPPRWSF